MTRTAPNRTAEAPARLRLTGPPDVVAAVPYLIGFQPANSVVLLSLRGPRRRLGLTMRADLPAPEDVSAVVTSLGEQMHRNRAEAVIAVFYADEAAANEVWPALREAIDNHGIVIDEALRVTDGRWWSYRCSVPACCPPGGTVIRSPLDGGQPARVGAELVGAGLAVLNSREDLVNSVSPADPEVLAAVEAELATAAEDVVRRLARPGGLAACRREWQRDVLAALTEWSVQHAPPPIPDAAVAQLLIALADVATRDVAAEWAGSRADLPTSSVQSLWRELTRRAPAPYDVAPATLLAHAAWLEGNGALARVAVERALGSDPSYRLAQLLERLLDEGVDPATARRLQPRTRRRRR